VYDTLVSDLWQFAEISGSFFTVLGIRQFVTEHSSGYHVIFKPA
jgi:hypothetical protein